MRLLLILLLSFYSVFAFAQTPPEFITLWDLSLDAGSGPDHLEFSVKTAGNVNYSWVEIGGNSASGSGVLNEATPNLVALDLTGVAVGGTVRLNIEPTSLLQFGTQVSDDSKRLIDVEQWGSTVWTTMYAMFQGCENLIDFSATDTPDLSNVEYMSYMFALTYNFNGDISNWDLSNVSATNLMFALDTAFNQDIGTWSVSNVTNMSQMFQNAKAFNQDLNSWNVSRVKSMGYMFQGASNFSSNLSNWQVDSVTEMSYMFNGASAFNGSIENWNVSSATNMSSMFLDAQSFDQNIGAWDLSGGASLSNFLDNSGMSCENYSNTLIGWEANASTPYGITVGASGLSYNNAGKAARDELTGTYSWSITGDAHIGASCNPVIISIYDSQHPNCEESPDGYLTGYIQNGASPFDVELYKDGSLYSSNNSYSDTLITYNNLPEGTYKLKVIDANTTADSVSIFLTYGTSIVINSSTTDVVCNGENNGVINITASGGEAPYTYTWSNFETTQNISNLVAGNYTVTVTDMNGCKEELTSSVTEPSPLTISFPTISDISCYDAADGAIYSSVSGGTPNYAYSWSNGETTQNVFGLDVGLHTLTVTDGNGCNESLAYTLTNPAQEDPSFNYSNTSFCQGSSPVTPTITGDAGGTFSANPFSGLTFSTTSGQIVPGDSDVGSYWIKYTTGGSCPEADSVQISITASDNTNFGYADTAFCLGDGTATISMTPVSGGTYTSSPIFGIQINSSTGEIDHSTGVAGSYDITYTTTGACENSSTIEVDLLEVRDDWVASVYDEISFCDSTWVDLRISGTQTGVMYTFRDSNTTNSVAGQLEGNGGVLIFPNQKFYSTIGLYARAESKYISGCLVEQAVLLGDVDVKNSKEGDTTATACDSFTWYGNTLSSTGIYFHTLIAQNGCDSIVQLNLTLYATPAITDTSASVCGELNWYGNTLNSSGTYFHNLTSVYGCDSTLRLTLTVLPTSSSTTIAEQCYNYTWTNGMTYSTSGTYTQTLVAANGCDSIATLNLTIHGDSISHQYINTCDFYIWGDGNTYDSDGTYIRNLTTQAGCDSTAYLHLTVEENTPTDTAATACESFTWYGTTYVNSGVYTHDLSSQNGCDSTIRLTLTVSPHNSSVQNVTACNSYTWSTNGTTYSASGTFQEVLTNRFGCDSTVTLNLTVNYSTSSTIVAESCGNYLAPNGNNYTSTGSYALTIPNAAGCDSNITLNLTVYDADETLQEVSTCTNFTTPKGNVVSTSGTYRDTLINQNGCDSIIITDLTILPKSTSSESVIACDSYSSNGNFTYNSTGSFQENYTNIHGCDSTHTINLTIISTNYDTIEVSACDSYTTPSGKNTYFQSGTYLDTITGPNGCESIFSIELSLYSSEAVTVNQTACDAYLWEATGQKLESSGTYTTTLSTIYGCDSVVTLNLTLFESTQSSESQSACGSYTWPISGETYTNSGTYTYITTNSNGCEHVNILELQINSDYLNTNLIEACGTFYWAETDRTYKSSGVFEKVFTTSSGCDSILRLDLFLHTIETFVSETACDSFYWENTNATYSNSGTYSKTYTNIIGCDSTVFLNLTIGESYTNVEQVSTCQPYYWPVTGETYAANGTYRHVKDGVLGCDSTFSLILEITPFEAEAQKFENNLFCPVDGAAYQWVDCDNNFEFIAGATNQEFAPTRNGSYAVIVTQDECSDTSECISVSGVGIFTLGGSNFSVSTYPNPTEGLLHVNWGIALKGLIEITDITGKVVLTQAINNQSEIDLEIPAAKGVYLLSLMYQNQAVYHTKVVKR